MIWQLITSTAVVEGWGGHFLQVKCLKENSEIVMWLTSGKHMTHTDINPNLALCIQSHYSYNGSNSPIFLSCSWKDLTWTSHHALLFYHLWPYMCRMKACICKYTCTVHLRSENEAYDMIQVVELECMILGECFFWVTKLLRDNDPLSTI